MLALSDSFWTSGKPRQATVTQQPSSPRSTKQMTNQRPAHFESSSDNQQNYYVYGATHGSVSSSSSSRSYSDSSEVELKAASTDPYQRRASATSNNSTTYRGGSLHTSSPSLRPIEKQLPRIAAPLYQQPLQAPLPTTLPALQGSSTYPMYYPGHPSHDYNANVVPNYGPGPQVSSLPPPGSGAPIGYSSNLPGPVPLLPGQVGAPMAGYIPVNAHPLHNGDIIEQPHPGTANPTTRGAPPEFMTTFSSKHAGRNLKKHICNICSKGFTRPSSLQTHTYSHTGEKPYRCEGCGRHFSVVSNLRRHKKIHELEGTTSG